MKSHRKLFWVLLWVQILISGCWDGRELEKRAIVLIIGIDVVGDGVRVGLQLARPQSMSGSASEQSAGGGSEVVTVVSREGADVSAALHLLQLAVDRDLFFGHTRVVVMSEDAARDGVLPHLQPLYGGAALLPRSAWLFITKGTAGAILELRPALDRIPATYLTQFFDNRILLQRPSDVTMGAFHRHLVTPGQEPVVLWIAPGQPDQPAPSLLGLAAFNGDRFVGGLDMVHSKGWSITQHQPTPGRLPVKCPDRPGTFAVRVIKSRNRIRPRTRGGTVTGLTVTANVQGQIEGVDCRASLGDPREMERFDQAFRAEIADLVQAGIRRAKEELKSDVFGFGKATHRYAYQAWPGDERWSQLFPDLPVHTDVTAQLDYTGSYRETDR